MTCEFVTISTFNNRSRIVILIYNILYIYINYYYLLFVISSSFLIFLPPYRTSLMSQSQKSQSTICVIFPDQVDSFFNCSNCSFVCLFAPNPTLSTSNAGVQPFVPLSAPHPLRGGVPGKGGGVNKAALVLQTMALCAINYGSFLLKVPQTLIAGTSFSDSGNVKRW